MSEVEAPSLRDHFRALWVSLLPLYDPLPELPIWLVNGRRNNEYLHDAETLVQGQYIDLPLAERGGALARIARGNPPIRYARYRRDMISDENHAWTYIFSPGESA